MRHKTNTYDLSGDYGIGYTSKGEEFWFDLEDFEKIKNYCWYFSNCGYLKARSLVGDGWQSDKIYLHRVVMNAKNGEIVDHIAHGNGELNYDNRKSNLRIVGYSENGMNSVLPKNNKSGYKGVFYSNTLNRWIARICVNTKTIYLGTYVDINDAIEARKQAEQKYYGEYNYCSSITQED